MARTLKHDAEVNRCARCGHPYLTHVPELRPGYRACASGTCTCEDLVKPEPPAATCPHPTSTHASDHHWTGEPGSRCQCGAQFGVTVRMPLGRPGSAGLLSDPPGGESTQLCPHPTSTHTADHQWAPGAARCGCGALGPEARELTPTEAIRAAQDRHAGETRSHLLARPRRPGYLDLQAELDRYREVLTEAMGATKFLSHAELRAYAADAIRYVRPGCATCIDHQAQCPIDHTAEGGTPTEDEAADWAGDSPDWTL